MKPYRTLRQLLVHPKDQRTVEQIGGFHEMNKSAITDHVAKENHVIN